MTEIQGKSILVRVSARFELARVRVIGSQGRYLGRYFIYLPHDYDNYKKMPKKKKCRKRWRGGLKETVYIEKIIWDARIAI